MHYPLNALRNVRLGHGLVKAFWVALMVFSTHVRAQDSYAKLIIEQGLFWLPHYLETDRIRQVGYPDEPVRPELKRKAQVLDEFRRIATLVNLKAYEAWYEVDHQKHGFKWKDIVQFRPGGDKVFDLKEHEPARMAVTGTDVDSQVIFNLGLISSPEQFSFADSLALWTHEIGHKVKMTIPDLTQKEIDELAERIGTFYGRSAKIYEVGARKLFVLSPTLLKARMSEYPYSPLGVIPVSFGVIENGEFHDLSDEMNHALNQAIPQSRNYLEHERWIYNLQLLSEGKILIELGTIRMPLDLNSYSTEQIGGTFAKIGVLNLGPGYRSVTVESYNDQVAPRELITDADAEIESLTLSPDQNAVTGLIRFHMKNVTHFHAMSYPTLHFDLLGLLDGRPVRIEAQALLRVTRDVSAMPAEIHKRTTMAEGRLSFSTRELRGTQLEITGVESRFFRLGGYDPREQKRIRVRQTREISLGCENLLVKNDTDQGR